MKGIAPLTEPRRLILVLCLATFASIAICTTVPIRPLDAIAAIPLVLLLPGAALVAAIDPWSARLRRGERLYWAFASSIATTILGGLFLNEVSTLDRFTWCLFLAFVITTASIISWDRNGPLGRHRVRRTVRRKGRQVSPRSLLLLGCAAGLLAGSLVLSQVSSARASREKFTQLWILPVPVNDADYASHFEVGIANYEGSRATFLVWVMVRGQTRRFWRLQLDQAQAWQDTLSRRGFEPVYVTVSLASDPRNVLSSVHLAAPPP